MHVYTFDNSMLGDGIGSVTWLDSMPDRRLLELPDYSDGGKRTAPGDKAIVDAARVSISGQEVRPTSDDRKLIRYLVKNKHTTPIEQVVFKFHVRLPIFCARQWIRHRTGSFNEESARYGKLASDFYVPSIERLLAGGQAKVNKQGSTEAPYDKHTAQRVHDVIKTNSKTAYYAYEAMLEQGVARELARMVLPSNIYTQWIWRTDLHNLMHFLNLRLNPHAQWEMQQYAKAILHMIRVLVPYAIEAWEDMLDYEIAK